MPRLARVVLPEYPHHIVQRGNRRQAVFFKESDYLYYISLLKHWSETENIDILAYCLMNNHVHLMAIPHKDSNLSRAIGETHRRYTRMVNSREQWTGYLWQGRFSSYVLDEHWLLNAMAYVELNPVKADITNHAWEYRWSSVHGHLSGKDPLGLLAQKPASKIFSLVDWKKYLVKSRNQKTEKLEQHERTGRPLGSDSFVEMVGTALGRDLQKKKPGPKPQIN